MTSLTYTVGSLFDGSGGFPLAGTLCGIAPRWASEVEPYPIAVTKKNFPEMRHLGDISKVKGWEIEPVDIITFGSPCQDLSVAGKRAGIKHETRGAEETTRSGLFMEAVRIIKEMRQATNGKQPRFALWENVPGAFSSNKGEDFRIVLEELIKVIEPEASVPEVPPNGWSYSDCYIGDGWSLAYRVLDAQYWGVPQRRRRIYLVADFGAKCSEKILFKSPGVRGYSEAFGKMREDHLAKTSGTAGETGKTFVMDYFLGSAESEVAPTLCTKQGNMVARITKDESYIRRLTPTECARLQGFPDDWGDLKEKTHLSKDELHFWQEVRNTHANINGRTVKDFTEKQLLNWYNKLESDSAKYKLWGNGIAIPNALYCMQGIVDALERTTT